VTLLVNGEQTELPDGLTVSQLVQRLELNPDGVAVALNLEVVPRGEHGSRVLAAGDRVELVRAVGGG
jgi:sulfur carrier protein